MKIRPVIFLVLLGTVLSSCSVTRRMQPDEYLLVKNHITVQPEKNQPRSERVAREELSEYVRQRPNKRLFGIPFFLQIYNLSSPERQNWTKRVGEPPVIYDQSLTDRTVEALSIYMHGRGFFSSSVKAIPDTVGRRKIKVEYKVTTGDPLRIGTVKYEFQDKFVEPLILEDSAATLIHSGDLFDRYRLQEERQRITGHLKNQGFYNFSINNISPAADTVSVPGTANLTMRIRQRTVGLGADNEPILQNNTVYRIRNIYIQPDYNASLAIGDSLYFSHLDTLEYRGVYFLYHRELNVRPDVLMRAINLYPNDLYRAENINRAYDNLVKLNYFRNTNILFTELPDSLSNLVSFVGDDGTGNYTREGYLDCMIRCTPGTRQSYSVDLEAATASTYYGFLTTVGYQNRNLLKGAESIDFSVTFGYEFMRIQGRKNSIELGGALGITYPRFVAPLRFDPFNRMVNPRTRAEISINYQDRPFYRRTLTSANWGYNWSNRRYSSFVLRPIDVSVVNMAELDTNSDFYKQVLQNNPYLLSSFQSQLIAGISGSYIYNNLTKHPNANSFRLRLNGETNGNLAGLAARFFSKEYTDDMTGKPYYHLFGIRYAQYVRSDLDLSYRFVLGAKTALAARFNIGAGHAYGNSANSSIPFERQFYAGGPNSMRGWQVRTLGPGSSLADEYKEQAEGETRTTNYPARVGNFKFETNLEFRFPVYRFLNGAVFTDLGNIWQIGAQQDGVDPAEYFRFNRFYDQLGFDAGLGARFDFNFFLFRVDWGIQLHNPNKPAGEKWMKNLTLRQTTFSFSVGYPF